MATALDFLVRHGYALLFFACLVEQLGVPLPSTPLLLAAGALASAGKLSPAPALLLAVLAAVLGHAVWFEAGRRRGVQVLGLLCKLSLEPDSCVRRTQDVFAARGDLTIVLAPWVPGLGGVAPPLAGMSGMPILRFMAIDFASSGIWASAFFGLGFVFADQLQQVLDVAGRFGTAAAVVLALALAAYLGVRYLRRRRLLLQVKLLRIEPAALKRLLDENAKVVLFDVRHPREAEQGMIPGARHISLADLEALAPTLPRDADVVFYCS